MFVALLDLQLDLLVKVEDIAWFCYSFLKDPVEIESTSAWCKLHAIHLWICPPVQCSEDLSSIGMGTKRTAVGSRLLQNIALGLLPLIFSFSKRMGWGP